LSLSVLLYLAGLCAVGLVGFIVGLSVADDPHDRRNNLQLRHDLKLRHDGESQ